MSAYIKKVIFTSTALKLLFTVVSFSLIGEVCSDEDFICPPSCVCTKASVRVQPPIMRWVKLKCGSRDQQLSTIEDLDFKNLNNSEIITL